MIASVRAVTSALALLLAGSTAAAAQQRACAAADSARVAWASPPAVAADAWRKLLMAEGVMAPGTEMVRVAMDSMPGAGESERNLARKLGDVIRERFGDRHIKVVVVTRVEADSSLSRVLIPRASGGLDRIEGSLPETLRRMRYSPLLLDGCPVVTLSPIIIETFPTQTIGAATPNEEMTGVGRANNAWVNLVSVWRLRDEFARRPRDARNGVLHESSWGAFDMPVDFPEPYRSRAFTGESFALLDVDSAGRPAGCRPLRPGAHPELDAYACTLLMRRSSYAEPGVPRRASLAGPWVLGLRWEGLTGAAHRERLAELRSPAVSGPPAMRQPPSDRWLKIRGREGEDGTWIDTTSVVQLRENVFRFALRYMYSSPMKRLSDGRTTTGSEQLMEFDCGRGRERILVRKELLGERVVEEAELTGQWSTGRSIFMGGVYCPVLTQARPAPPPATSP